jgi:hypothetical protein
MTPSKVDPPDPNKNGGVLPLDYAVTGSRKKEIKFGTMAGNISFFAMLIQIPWAVPSIIFFMSWMVDKEYWDKAIWPKVTMALPTIVAFIFGSYSVWAIGINRRNIKGILGLSFAIAFVVWLLITK